MDIFHVKHLSADEKRRYWAAPVNAACRRSKEKHGACQISDRGSIRKKKNELLKP
ncbi:hypothetical protein A4U88_3998 [Serratia marcescens]|nr:hypothetical protein A4U88_3998 [Serratia marcescens]